MDLYFEILKLFVRNSLVNLHKEVVWEHLRFIMEHRSSDIVEEFSTSDLALMLKIPATDNSLHDSNEIYLNTPELVDLFENIPNVLYVDPFYTNGNQKHKWETFLIELGVNPAPRLHLGIRSDVGLSTEFNFLLEKCVDNELKGLALLHIVDNWLNWYSCESRYCLSHSLSKIKVITSIGPNSIKETYCNSLFIPFKKYIPLLDTSLVLKNFSFLEELGLKSSVNETNLASIQLLLKNVEDTEVWTYFYSLCKDHSVFIKEIYSPIPDEDGNHFIAKSEFRWSGDNEIASLLDIFLLSKSYPEKLMDYFVNQISVPKTLTANDCKNGLIHIFMDDNQEYRQKNDVKKMESLIWKIYRHLNFLVTEHNLTSIYCFVINYRYTFMGLQNAIKKMVISDDDQLKNFIFDIHGKGYIPISYVHPELMSYPNLLKVFGIPVLSEVVIKTPFPETRPELLKQITNKYRACLAFALKLSRRVLNKDEIIYLEKTERTLEVYQTTKLFVEYEVLGYKKRRIDPYHFNKNSSILIISNKYKGK